MMESQFKFLSISVPAIYLDPPPIKTVYLRLLVLFYGLPSCLHFASFIYLLTFTHLSERERNHSNTADSCLIRTMCHNLISTTQSQTELISYLDSVQSISSYLLGIIICWSTEFLMLTQPVITCLLVESFSTAHCISYSVAGAWFLSAVECI